MIHEQKNCPYRGHMYSVPSLANNDATARLSVLKLSVNSQCITSGEHVSRILSTRSRRASFVFVSFARLVRFHVRTGRGRSNLLSVPRRTTGTGFAAEDCNSRFWRICMEYDIGSRKLDLW